jgi:hypothetical protein
LASLPPFKLMRLAIYAARSLHLVHKAEAEARASLPLPGPEEEAVEVFEITDWEPAGPKQ